MSDRPQYDLDELSTDELDAAAGGVTEPNNCTNASACNSVAGCGAK
jgi:hypothetical protein